MKPGQGSWGIQIPFALDRILGEKATVKLSQLFCIDCVRRIVRSPRKRSSFDGSDDQQHKYRNENNPHRKPSVSFGEATLGRYFGIISTSNCSAKQRFHQWIFSTDSKISLPKYDCDIEPFLDEKVPQRGWIGVSLIGGGLMLVAAA